MTRAGTRAGTKVVMAFGAATPAVLARATGVQLEPAIAVVVFGGAVVATALLLTWAAEAAQVDISGRLATAILAVVAVLPEYAVDLYFAFGAGHDPSRSQFAAANMTGANRLLIGIGWPLVAFIAFVAWRRRGGPGRAGRGERAVELGRSSRVELGFLACASIFAVAIVVAGSLAWWASIVLIGLFALYLWRLAREQRSEPALVGVSAVLGGLPPARRRATVAIMFLSAVVVVLAAAEPFAEGLVSCGASLGVDQFVLVQWLGPIASEAPELIVAGLFAWRLRASDGFGVLLSSKVNQWTLLVGSLPLAYLAGGGHHGLALDARQSEELLLTAAQAMLGVAVVIDLSFGIGEAALLLSLFLVQFAVPGTTGRLALSAVYATAAVAILVAKRRHLGGRAGTAPVPRRPSRAGAPR